MAKTIALAVQDAAILAVSIPCAHDGPIARSGDIALKRKPVVAVLAACWLLAGCVAPVGPVEITRFHVPDTARLGAGTIRIEAGPGTPGDSPEFRSYAAAVARQLVLLGYREETSGGPGEHIVQVSLSRQTWRKGAEAGPVTVGIGGTAGSYGTGVGVGLGLNLSGSSGEQVTTQLAVMIRDRASGTSLWEGRAKFTVKATSPLASSQLGAAKMAEALFKEFPGQSGETILVE